MNDENDFLTETNWNKHSIKQTHQWIESHQIKSYTHVDQKSIQRNCSFFLSASVCFALLCVCAEMDRFYDNIRIASFMSLIVSSDSIVSLCLCECLDEFRPFLANDLILLLKSIPITEKYFAFFSFLFSFHSCNFPLYISFCYIFFSSLYTGYWMGWDAFYAFLAVLFHWIVRWCQLPNHHIFLPLVSNSFCVKTYTHKSDALLLILLLYYVRWFHNFSLLFVLLCHSHSIENYSFIYSDVLNLSTHILATMAFEVCHTKDQKRLMYNFWIDIKTTFIHYGAHTHTDDLMLARMWRKL